MKFVVLPLVLCASAAFAQVPPVYPTPPPPPPSAPRVMPGSEQIVGNKKTHVYHFSTDKGLPSPKNRVMFSSVSAAVAAGYHAPGKGAKKFAPKTMPHAMMHGKPPAMMPTTAPPAPPHP